jgi:hypothetical protein
MSSSRRHAPGTDRCAARGDAACVPDSAAGAPLAHNERVDQEPDVDAVSEPGVAPALTSPPSASMEPEPSPPVEDPAAIAAQREERSRARMRQTVRDMLLSMLVVTGAVIVLVLPWNRSNPDPVRVVDPAPVVAAARTALDWPVLAPVGLAPTWRATSARLEVASDGQSVVHLGYLSPSTMYVGLEQSATKELAFVREQTQGGKATGTADISGRTWDRLESPDGKQRSLVRVDDGVTYVVTGAAEWPEIEQFTRALVAG